MTTLPTSLADNEVVLGDYRLPIQGRVQVTKATQHPGKVTIGQTTRADQVLADEWVQDDWREGLLISQLDEQTQKGRFWWSTVDTLRRRKMMLAPKAFNLEQPAGETDFCETITEFGDYTYFSFQGHVYRWEDATSSWSTILVDLGGVPTDAIVFKGALLYALNSSYYRFDGASWVSHSTDVKHFVKFDVNPSEKLMAIDANGTLRASADGITWTEEVGGKLDDAVPNDLIAFRNPSDEPTLFIGTNQGLFSCDPWTRTVYATSLAILPSTGAGSDCCVWSDGNLYFPDGLALWRYPRLGQITNVGLDREDGVPTFIRGKITHLTQTPNYIIAVIDATQLGATLPEELFMGAEWGTYNMPMSTTAGYSAIMAWNGSGWHCLYLSDKSSTGIHDALLTTVYLGERRLFFSDDLNIKYLALPEGNYDPSLDENAHFAESGVFETSWFDGGYSEITKLAISFKMRCLRISNTETIAVHYAINDVEAYTYLGTVTSDTIDDAGRAKFHFNVPTGIHFYSIKFRFTFTRAPLDDRQSPVLLFFDLRYKRMPDILWGWTFTVCGTEYAHLTDAWTAVKDLVNSKLLVRFGFRADSEEEKIVEVINISGIRYGGNETVSTFTVTVVELESA